MNALAPASEWRNCADPTTGRRATTYGEGENVVGVTIKILLRHQHLAGIWERLRHSLGTGFSALVYYLATEVPHMTCANVSRKRI